MAAVTFGALKSRIQAEVNRPSSANLAFIGNAIVTAIMYYETKPAWFTEKKDTLTLLSGDNSVALPDDFKAIIGLRLLKDGFYRGPRDGFKGTDIKALEDNWTDATLSQTPVEWALFNGSIYFNCLADQDYTLPITYHYGDVTYPSADGDTSVWFDAGQDLIRYKATAIFYEDRLHDVNMGQLYEGKAQEFLQNVISRSQDRAFEYSLR